MLEMITAYTMEIDEVDVAVEELLSQLDLGSRQYAHAVGIVACYSEYIDSGAFRALSERLPFDVVGCTSINSGVSGASDMLMLSLTVLLSDERVRFTAVETGPVAEGTAANEGAYDVLAPLVEDSPALALCFLPFLEAYGGELMLQQLQAVLGDTPVFGTICCSHDSEDHYATSAVLHNGRALNDRIVVLLLYGDVRPRFVLSAIPDARVQKQRAMITASEGSVLKEVNDKPVLRYMEELGLKVDDGLEGAFTIPFMVDYRDGGQPVARAFYLRTPEDYIVCGGEMPVGATIAPGTMEQQDVLETSRRTVEAIRGMQDVHGVLLFTCLSRLATLGLAVEKELDVFRDGLKGIPYLACYSGGELCPLYNEEKATMNRFHNFSVVACVL